MSSVKSRSVSVTAGWCIDRLGVMVNPSSDSRPSVALCRAKSRTMMKRKGARVSPCSTPAVILNQSVSPSGVYLGSGVRIRRFDGVK